MRRFSRRISGSDTVPGLTWKTADGEIRAYVRSLETANILHEGAHALAFAIGFEPAACEPLQEIFEMALRAHRSVDPAFSGSRSWSYSLKDCDEFFAQLLATTVTDEGHDPAHPLLHPCAEKLWPGSTPHILAVEASVHAACERALAERDSTT